MENFIKEIGGYIIGIGGLLIAGLSLYFNYKERIKNLRESLFNKQIEIINELSLIITKLFQSKINLFDEISHFSVNNQDKDEYYIKKLEIINNNWNEIEKTYNGFVEKYRTWLMFLPNDINNTINDFINNYLDIQFTPSTEPKIEDIKKIISKYDKVFDSIRKFFGIEKLSEVTKNY